MTQRVVITHPLSSLLTQVAATWNDTLRGNWGTAVLNICADKIANPDAARRELDAIGESFAVGEDRFEPLTFETGDDTIAFNAPVKTVAPALDLFARILCGQWNELRWHCTLHLIDQSLPAVDLTVVRANYSRPYDKDAPFAERGFPDHPFASTGIAESTLPAKVAYHAYKALGAGAPGTPTFSLPEGALRVEVIENGAAVGRAPDISPERAQRILSRPRPALINVDPDGPATF